MPSKMRAQRPLQSTRSNRLRRYGTAIATFTVVGILLGLSADAATTFPPGFAQTAVFTGHTKPVSVRFAPDGQIFIGEQNGLVWAYDNLNDTTATQVIDVSIHVHSYWDRGMLGLAIDPGYPVRPYLYIFYAHNVDENGVGPRWFDPDDPLNPNDICPTPPGGTVDGCVIYGRLSRIVVDTMAMTGVEEPLLDGNWCQQYPSHSVGDLVFGDDGMLYASAGEGASFIFADAGQGGSPTGEAGVPINPCGDPPGGVGEFPEPPDGVTAEGGALRSQDLLTPADRTDLLVPDPTSFDGTILRIDISDESELPKVPSDNPLFGGTVLDDDYIVAMGLRNPYRMARRGGTGELWVGDVGGITWEEINRVGDVFGDVENFGWPCYEGDNTGSAIEPRFDRQNLCIDLYADNIPPGLATTAPYFAYNHDEKIVEGEACGTGSSAIAGLAFYTGANYPAIYSQALAFADSSRRCVWTMFTPPGGDPDKTDILALVSNAGGRVVDVQMAPDGNLYYVEYLNFGNGKVNRIEYTLTNDPPLVYITRPLDGARFVSGASIDFAGSASDTEDGDLTASLTWTSSLDGPIGTGGSFSTSTLSLGLHTITAETTDSNSDSGSDAISIQVLEEVVWELQVFLSGTGSGVVTSSPPGVDCGVDCDELYPQGTVVTLTTTPDPGSDFIAWNGDPDCGDGQVTMTADLVCDAQFDARDASYCFNFDNLCDGIEITSVRPDKTVAAIWRNWDCAGATAPMLGGYSGKSASPKLSWLAADPNANLKVFNFNLNVDSRTFDLFRHDTAGDLIQFQDNEPYSVTPGPCPFSPEKDEQPASTGVGN